MIEWYNSNMNRSYPLKDDVSAVDVSGQVLPTSVIVDLQIAVPSSVLGAVYISAITLTPGLMAVSIEEENGGGILVGSFPAEGLGKVLQLFPVIPGASGFIVFGERPPTSTVYRFSGSDASQLVESAIHRIEGFPVQSIGPSNSDGSQRLTGLIRLDAGDTFTLTRNGNDIIMGLTDAAKADMVSPCDGTSEFTTCGRPPIRTLGGVPPDANGELTIEVGQTTIDTNYLRTRSGDRILTRSGDPITWR